jgi:hypothetical protein
MSYTSPSPDDRQPTARKPRCDGWTTERQVDFLVDLAEHGSVGRAAAAVGLSPSSAYRLRSRDAAGAFGKGWEAAMAMAYYHFRDVALERIDNGVYQAHFYRGEMVGTKATYSDRLLIAMLNHLKPAATAGVPDRAADPALAFGAAIDAYAVALDTGTAPVAPAAPPAGPTAASDDDDGDDIDPVRVAAAQDRLARGLDPYETRIPGRVYAPRPDAAWLAWYPDGMMPVELAFQSEADLRRVGLVNYEKYMASA